MTLDRRRALVALALAPAGAAAQTALPGALPAPGAPPGTPAAPAGLGLLAGWIGGEWIAETDGPGGRRIKLVRDYQWSFERRLIVGRSWTETDGRRVQTRETHYHWNPDSRRIEFLEHFDQQGGHGLGYIELREGQLFLNVRMVGNPAYPDWRAWLKDSGEVHEVRVDTLRGTQWSTVGTYRYQRTR